MARSAAVLLRRKAALGLRTWQLLHEERARQRSVLMGVALQLHWGSPGYCTCPLKNGFKK